MVMNPKDRKRMYELIAELAQICKRQEECTDCPFGWVCISEHVRIPQDLMPSIAIGAFQDFQESMREVNKR